MRRFFLIVFSLRLLLAKKKRLRRLKGKTATELPKSCIIYPVGAFFERPRANTVRPYRSNVLWVVIYREPGRSAPIITPFCAVEDKKAPLVGELASKTTERSYFQKALSLQGSRMHSKIPYPLFLLPARGTKEKA